MVRLDQAALKGTVNGSQWFDCSKMTSFDIRLKTKCFKTWSFFVMFTYVLKDKAGDTFLIIHNSHVCTKPNNEPFPLVSRSITSV